MQSMLEEKLGNFPNLLALFQEYERELVRARLGIHKKQANPERIENRNETLLQVAQSITACELKLLYYLRNTDGINADTLLKTIKKMYHAQCDFKNQIDGGKREDILQLVKGKGRE